MYLKLCAASALIHNLHKEMYMEEKYSEFLEDSYKAVDKTNFYDAVYSPVILISNALTIAIVMVLSSLKNGEVQLFFRNVCRYCCRCYFLYYTGIYTT